MLNIHSHYATHDAIYNIRYGVDAVPTDLPERFSVGIHPWDAAQVAIDDEFMRLAASALFIGECGLDKAHSSVPMSIQRELFERQIVIAEKLHRPMIIHCVKAYGTIGELRAKSSSPLWIIHACNASMEWVRCALKYDVAFSFGMRELHREALHDILRTIPLDRLFLETDDDTRTTIADVYNAASKILGISTNELTHQIEENFRSAISRRS